MAFVDEVTISAKAGDGGDGVVRFRREKNIDKGGPSGGNGGNGGNVYAKALRDVHLLAKYKIQKEFKADDGGVGGKKKLEGAGGKDLEINFPVGSIITNIETGHKISLNTEGEQVLLLKGGRGGLGNDHFKSSTNVTPKECTPGKAGEKGVFFVEVELIADIGLIGLPSAGKTSLLNALTAAKAKVGAYPFTTLEPNLGECFGFIISDIPGLIEGASDGKGLGHKFLRHIKRTKVIVHLVSVENKDPLSAYKVVQNELSSYDKELVEKKEIVVLTKIDLIKNPEEVNTIRKKLSSLNKEIHTVSVKNEKSVKMLREIMIEAVK